jgi:hypothetical protein
MRSFLVRLRGPGPENWMCQGNLMGDQGQGAAGQLLRLPHPGLHHQGGQLQRGGDICAVQEPPAHGNILI